ncbi:MAG: hypothetical protein H7317_02400 [Pseudorhodobacter sp.]|nr:hypothetical protein [Pseudorhodobacter sp.]
MLAVFGLDPAPVLVDMVVVDSDRLTGFSDPATVSTGPGDAIIMIDNSHANAGQGYHQSTLVQLSGGQLLAIDTTRMLDLLVCGWRLGQHLTISPDTTVSPPWPLTVRVTETVMVYGDCGDDPQPMPADRSYAVTYARNPATGACRITKGNWSALDAVNVERY